MEAEAIVVSLFEGSEWHNINFCMSCGALTRNPKKGGDEIIAVTVFCVIAVGVLGWVGWQAREQSFPLPEDTETVFSYAPSGLCPAGIPVSSFRPHANSPRTAQIAGAAGSQVLAANVPVRVANRKGAFHASLSASLSERTLRADFNGDGDTEDEIAAVPSFPDPADAVPGQMTWNFLGGGIAFVYPDMKDTRPAGLLAATVELDLLDPPDPDGRVNGAGTVLVDAASSCWTVEFLSQQGISPQTEL